MKGTAAREADPAADARAREGLAASAKDRAENLMIVDLLRNDLGRVAEIGSVDVADLFAVETYPTLHQMVSTVTAKLKPGTGVNEIVRALFPCGSVTGAPKICAMEVIAELEESPRGVYCGAIGHFAPDGSARFNVSIRTLTITDARGELGIGGAVVQDSVADGEYAECLLKARFFEAPRRPLELIETLRFSPEIGFLRRDLHLARMARSADAFAIAFDETIATRALDEAVTGAQTDLRVRLALAESGEFSCNRRVAAAESGALDLRDLAAEGFKRRRTLPPQNKLARAIRTRILAHGLRRSRLPQPARRGRGRQPQQRLRGARWNASHPAVVRRRARRLLAPRADRRRTLRRSHASARELG